MKKKSLSIVLAAILAANLFLVSGSSVAAESEVAEEAAEVEKTAEPAAESESAEAGSITITDMIGHEVTLDAVPERVVALSAADCEILYAIGAGDKVVGRGEYCDYPAEVLDVPSVQSGNDTNIEQIIELDPQVVFMSSMAQTEEQVKALEDAGIACVVSEAYDIAGVYDSVNMLGTLTGHEAEAAEVVAGMQETFAALEEKKVDGGTVYFEVSPLEYGLWTAGSGTFYDEIAQMIGLENVFADVETYGEISEEQVIERNPDYIVTITMYFGEGPTPVEEILGRAGWETITAVQNQAVLNLQNNELSRPVPRLAEGAQMLYDFVTGAAAEDAEAA